MQNKSWYQLWFDSPYYHLLYKDRDDREAARFIDAILGYFAPSETDHFLDLACGRGRHSIYINSKGFQVTGLDLSVKNIQVAQQHEKSRLNFAVHDMRQPYKKDAFTHVLNLFTSFGYFSTMEKNSEVLTSTHFNLKENGMLLIDFLNIKPVADGLVKEEKKTLKEIEFKINRSIENGVILKNIEVNDHGKVFHFAERVQALSLADFEAMLDNSSFTITDVFGDYNLSMYSETISPRLIISARKR